MDLDQQTLDALDWPLVVETLAGQARTSLGARAARELRLARCREEILELLDETGEIIGMHERGVESPPLSGIEDVRPLLERAEREETLDLDALRLTASTVAALFRLGTFFETQLQQAPVLGAAVERIDIDAALRATLERAFDERGNLSERAYPLLGELRRRIAGLERRIRTALDELLASDALSSVLQDRYVTMRGDRFVLPIKAEAKHSNVGIVHDGSRSGQTVFVEPAAIVPLGNDKRRAESQLLAEERRICRDLSRQIAGGAETIRSALTVATRIDLAVARAGLARLLDATRPQVEEDGVLTLRAARHPVLLLGGKQVVANDLAVDGERPVLIFTGANAGGKTIALKTMGLCAVLVRAGCFVPAASGSRVDVFCDVLADIGDQQSVRNGLSSFSAHLRNMREMLERNRPGVLLLLDEVASGTDPTQGGALARALIERLADGGGRVVATTHYAQLKAMAAADPRVVVAAMEYRDERPSYRVLPGVAGESRALEVARSVGIEASVVGRARDLMGDAERTLADALRALEKERDEARRLADDAARRTGELSRREEEVGRREEKIKARARDLEHAAAEDFLRRVREAERSVSRIVAELQARPSHRGADDARRRLDALRERAGDPRRLREAPPPAQQLRVGQRVRVPKLSSEGEVVGLRGDQVEVIAGRMSLRLSVSEVLPLAEAAGRRERKPGATGAAAGRTPKAGDLVRFDANTLDLRGKRVAEAVDALDRFLDRAMLEDFDGFFVLHGHGTNAVKKAVRAALRDSPYVAEVAPATDVQGGDALTAVVLRG